MGTPEVNAVREELYHRVREEFGDLKAAAEPLGVPYKTLYRNLTPKGKDRNETVTFDFIVDAVEHIRRRRVARGLPGDDFPTFYAAALNRVP